MKSLEDILYKVNLLEIVGSTEQLLTGIYFNSSNVVKNSMFVAIKGNKLDGHDFIDQAMYNGASVVLCEHFPVKILERVTVIRVKDTSRALAILASNFYDNPSQKIKLVGVTGTNGKTTVATLLHQMYQSIGKKSGLISTIVNKIGSEEIITTHTTPDVITINKLLSEMSSANCEYCFMEVSSHALHQNRVYGLSFQGAIFTNISHDHLDYHETFEQYILAKKILFDNLSKEAFALVNKDDKHSITMLQNCQATLKTYSIKTISDFKCRILENSLEGLLLNIDGQEVWTKLLGIFNAYNLLVSYATAVLLGESKIDALRALSLLNSAEGRFQVIRSENGLIGIVDYAHTPDALKNVLETIQVIRNSKQKVITVIGCGGDRDKLKRPLIAKIACELSDKIVFTSDNPRTEKPGGILIEMKEGLSPKYCNKYLTISDRKEAIKAAATLAESGDIILVAGKGHEKYQEINGIQHPFDDTKELENVFKLLDQ